LKIEFDSAKSETNARERKRPFFLAEEFDWDSALFAEDIRILYPELRFVAIGSLGQRLHVICFTPIEGGVRVIGVRKANDREVRRYEKETAHK
jgi:uncharacterized DUF497 family protein